MKIPDKWKYDNTLQRVLEKDNNLKEQYNKTWVYKEVKRNNDDKLKKIETVFSNKDENYDKSNLSSINFTATSYNRNSRISSINSELKTNSKIFTNTVTSTDAYTITDPNNTISSKENKVSSSLPKIKIKTNSKENYGPFLNILGFEKKIQIKNPLIKKLLDDTQNHGPYYTHCPSCQNKNLSFFKHLKENEAMKIITFIKEEKLQKQNKKVYIKSKLINKTLRGDN